MPELDLDALPLPEHRYVARALSVRRPDAEALSTPEHGYTVDDEDEDEDDPVLLDRDGNRVARALSIRPPDVARRARAAEAAAADRVTEAAEARQAHRCQTPDPCSRVVTPPAKAAPFSASWSTSIRATRGWWRWRNRAIANRRSGISSAMSATLPAGGEIVLFDRSWYNRAGVEKVMGFCTPDEHAQFLREAPIFERMLDNDGIELTKLWLSVSPAKQRTRFAVRLVDPVRSRRPTPTHRSPGRSGAAGSFPRWIWSR